MKTKNKNTNQTYPKISRSFVFIICRILYLYKKFLPSSALQAVIWLGCFNLGKEIHGYIMRSKLEYDVYVCTSLVDMYIWWFYNMGLKSLGCYTAMSSVGDRERREKMSRMGRI